MTKEEKTPIFMTGFLVGGVMLSLIASTEIHQLRDQLHTETQATMELLIEARSLHARFADLEARISGLAQRWEDDLAQARAGHTDPQDWPSRGDTTTADE